MADNKRSSWEIFTETVDNIKPYDGEVLPEVGGEENIGTVDDPLVDREPVPAPPTPSPIVATQPPVALSSPTTEQEEFIGGDTTPPEEPFVGTGPELHIGDSQQYRDVDNLNNDVIKRRAEKYAFAVDDPNRDTSYWERLLRTPGGLEREKESINIRNALKEAQARNELIEVYARTAAAQGRTFTKEEENVILSLTTEDLNELKADPNTFIEKQFAKRITDAIKVSNTEQESNLTKYPSVDGFIRDFITRKEGFQKIAEDAQTVASDRSWGQFGANIAPTLAPGFHWYMMSNLVSQHKSMSYLPGSNLWENIQALHRMPASEAVATAQRVYNDLNATNSVLAGEFANALLSYTSSQAFWDNLLVAGADIATFIPFTALAKLPAKAQLAAKTALEYRDVIATLKKHDFKTSELADAMGDTVTATLSKVKQELEARVSRTGSGVKGFKELVEEIPSIFNPQQIAGKVYNLSRESTARIVSRMNVEGDNVVKTILLDPLQRGLFRSSAAEKLALDNTLTDLTRQHPSLTNTVLDISTVEGGLTDTSEALIALGNSKGVGFEGAGEAHAWMKLYNLDGKVVKRGEAFHIEVRRPIDMTRANIRDQLKLDIGTQTRGFIESLVPFIRSANDIIPERVQDARLQSTFRASATAKVLGDIAEPFTKLKNKGDMDDFLQWESSNVNTSRPSDVSGNFSRTIGQLEKRWYHVHGRLPTEKEVAAYYSYVRLNDIHYLTRNIDMYLSMTRVGTQVFDLRIPIRNEKMPGITSLKAADLQGRIVENIPRRDAESANILVLDEKGGAFTFSNKLGGNSPNVKRARELMDNDKYSVVQLSMFGTENLGRLEGIKSVTDGRRVNYVVTLAPSSRPLPFKLIPRVEGGRRIIPHEHFISTPNLSKATDKKETIYYGDHNLFAGLSAKETKEVAKNMDTARRMLQGSMKSGDFSAVRTYVKENLPISWREFKNMYVGSVKRPAKFDVSMPILYRTRNQASVDNPEIGKYVQGPIKKFVDSEHNMFRSNVDLSYAIERGDLVREIVNKGDAQLPEFGVQPARTLNPVDSVNRALDELIRSNSLNPAKIEAAEDFIGRYGDILEMSVEEQRIDPFRAMLNAEFKKGADTRAVREAKAYRGRMVQFMNIKSEEHTAFQVIAEKLLGDVSPLAAKSFMTPFYEALRKGTGAEQFKAVAHHAYLGLMNPVQLVVQGIGATHAIALSPKQGLRGAATAMIQNIAMENIEQLTKEGGRYFKQLGWGSAEQFEEATLAMRRVGWDNVGREVSTRENHMTPNIVSSRIGRVLDWGRMPFNRGEMFTRRTAWNTAYLEWRASKPAAKLTDTDIIGILRRADTLSNNMTQASNAAWQQGLISIPTQFWSYQVRLLEQLYGKRLSTGEKAKMLGTYSLMYGVPITGSLATGFLPVHEMIRSVLIENGLSPDDNTITNIVSEGIIGNTVSGLFGENTTAEERFGPSGLPYLAEFLSGEKGPIEAFSGPSGNVLGEFLLQTYPVIPWLMSAMNPGDEVIPPKISDFTDILKVSSTWNAAERVAVALNTGHYLNRYGETIDVGNTGAKGVLYGLLGIKPQRIEDFYNVMNNDKKRKVIQRDLERKAFGDLRRMLDATNPEDADYYRRRANIIMSTPTFTPQEQMEAVSRFMRTDGRTLVERTIKRMDRDPDQHQNFIKHFKLNVTGEKPNG